MAFEIIKLTYLLSTHL